MRKTRFGNGEFYHIYNRGVDKRYVFMDSDDFARFIQSMKEFNTSEPIGSIYESIIARRQLAGSTAKVIKRRMTTEKLVRIVSYCLNPNHYHFVLEQVSNKGIEKFMQRLGTGFTKYFNLRHKRTGSLFQGPFKSKHIDSNDYLLYLSAYVNFNYRVHGLGSLASKCSWDEYRRNFKEPLCDRSVILGQFRNIGEYEDFAKETLKQIIARRQLYKELQGLLLE